MVASWYAGALELGPDCLFIAYSCPAELSCHLALGWCLLATERGVGVCAPVHDAILIEADVAEFEDKLAVAREAMAEASRTILGGCELKTDAKVIRWPDRYIDPRGEVMWSRVQGVLAGLEGSPPHHQPAA